MPVVDNTVFHQYATYNTDFDSLLCLCNTKSFDLITSEKLCLNVGNTNVLSVWRVEFLVLFAPFGKQKSRLRQHAAC